MNLTTRYVKFLIAEAALETVPREIAKHPSVIRNSMRRGKKPIETLLDVSIHYYAMKHLIDREKRGRPDILHIILLNLLSSPLNLEGKLSLLVHTYGNYVIKVNPSIRLPRNYNRFIGLMEQLFSKGKVPPNEKPLLEILPASFEYALKMLDATSSILLSEKGIISSPERICRESLATGQPIVIGGFPHGSFRNEVLSTASKVYSIYYKPLDGWVVASIMAHACEKVLKILL